MTIQLLSAAEQELRTAARYYEARCPGLGHAFLIEIRNTLRRIGEAPLAGTALRGNIRRRLVRRFPYALIYAVEGPTELLVLAVMHQRRRPNYWNRRP